MDYNFAAVAGKTNSVNKQTAVSSWQSCYWKNHRKITEQILKQILEQILELKKILENIRGRQDKQC